jgi:glycosyltransferase involved in cell wall biosynthesis
MPVLLSAITHGRPEREEVEGPVGAADRVLCYSEEEAEFYRTLFPEDPPNKYLVVALGVPEGLLADHNVVPRRSVFCAGSYHDHKGQLRVLRACKELDVPVNFAGPMDTPGAAAYLLVLKDEADDWGKARFFGILRGESLWDQYREAQVHVNAAAMEPFGLTTLEALACGANIVHPLDSWGAALFGQHGSLCNTLDNEALRGAIKYELDQPRDRHGWRPPTWQEATQSFQSLYEAVV